MFRVLAWNLPGRSGHEVRSAGTHPEPGGRALTEADLQWADVVCVMEATHEAYIEARWPGAARKVRVLGIPDIYTPGDAALRDLLTRCVLGLFDEAAGTRGASPGDSPRPPTWPRTTP